MKEFRLNLSPAIHSGLRPDYRGRLNQPFLEDAYNLVGSRFGLEELIISDPFDGEEAIAYPWPQIVRLQDKTLLLRATSIKEVNEGATPWTASSLTTYSISDGTTPKVITGTGGWHVADLGGAFYLTNGETVVFRHGLESLLGGAEKVFAQNDIPINTIAYHNGRVLSGGFTQGEFWDASWQAILETFKGYAPEDVTPGVSDIGQNYVMWSGIGGGDFPLALFFPDIYDWDTFIGAQDATDWARRNMFGFAQMPFQGAVLAILPLEDGFMVYGEDGIVRMKLYANDLASGYAPAWYRRVGCYSRTSVAGNDQQQIFIDTGGKVWLVDGKGMKALGYEEFFSQELGSGLRVYHDEYEERYFISGEKGYCLSANGGLTEIGERVCSVCFIEGGIVGQTDDTEEDWSDDVYALTHPDFVEIKTNPFDFGLRTKKSLTGVSIGYSAGTAVRTDVAIEYRFLRSDAWRTTRWVPVNKEGHATIRVSATEFKVKLRFSDKDDLQIDHLYVLWQNSDKRIIRGFIPQASIGQEDGSSNNA